MRAAARHGQRKVRQRYGDDAFGGTAQPLAGTQTSSGLMIWEDMNGQGVFGTGPWNRTGTGEVRPTQTSGPADGDAAAVVDTGYCDGWVRIQLLEGAGYGGILFRLTDGNNWWQCYAKGDGTVFLTKYVAGSPVSVWNSVVNPKYGDCLQVHLDGLTIEVYLNNTLLTTATDGHNNTATRHGIWSTTFVLGSVQPATGLGSFAFSKTALSLPSVPSAAKLDDAYGLNSTPSLTQSVSLGTGVDATDVAVLEIFEFPAAAVAVTSVSGMGGIWTQKARAVNSAGNIAMSVWVGVGLTTAGTTVTTTSSGNQTNEVNLARWKGIAGSLIGSAQAANIVVMTVDTGTEVVTTGRVVVGGVVLNTSQLPTWTDTPGAWTDLLGSSDFYPAYRIVTGSGSHDRSGAVGSSTNFAGLAVELG